MESDQFIFFFTSFSISSVFSIKDTLLSYNPSGLHLYTPMPGAVECLGLPPLDLGKMTKHTLLCDQIYMIKAWLKQWILLTANNLEQHFNNFALRIKHQLLMRLQSALLTWHLAVRQHRVHYSPDTSAVRQHRVHYSPDTSAVRQHSVHYSPDTSAVRQHRVHYSPDTSAVRQYRVHYSPDTSAVRQRGIEAWLHVAPGTAVLMLLLSPDELSVRVLVGLSLHEVVRERSDLEHMERQKNNTEHISNTNRRNQIHTGNNKHCIQLENQPELSQ